MPGAFDSPPDRLIENIPHIVWASRPDGYVNYMSEGGLKHLGARLEDVTGWGWIRNVHPADAGRTLEGWGDATSTGRNFETEYRMRTAEGEYRWHHAQGQPLLDDSGAITCWVGTCIDIDRWKQHEVFLRSANREIDETLAVLNVVEDRIPLGVALVDCSFRFVRVNAEFAAVTGLARAEHLGQTIGSLLPRLWEQLHPVCDAVLETRRSVWNLEIAGETCPATGEVRNWLTSFHPVIVGNELHGIVVVAQAMAAPELPA